MTREEAKVVLGLEGAVTEGAVHAAFRAASKGCHPNGATPDAARWALISQAKAVLLAPLPRCRTCGGTGRMIVGSLRVTCYDCSGSGVEHG
jgi:DnaJ-class molecular chaperone